MATPFFLGTGAEPGVGNEAAADGLGGGVWSLVQAARQAMAPTLTMRPKLTNMFLPLLTRLCSQSGSCESARRRQANGNGPWRKRSRARELARRRARASGGSGE